jgi:hypothetical protein
MRLGALLHAIVMRTFPLALSPVKLVFFKVGKAPNAQK